MAILANFLPCNLSRLGEQRKGIATSFHGAWLDASGAQANPWFGNQEQEEQGVRLS